MNGKPNKGWEQLRLLFIFVEASVMVVGICDDEVQEREQIREVCEQIHHLLNLMLHMDMVIVLQNK